MSDETYLEAFIESLATLPHEVRRNLELIKDLDKSSSVKADELVRLQEQYLDHVRTSLARTQIVKNPNGSVAGLQLLQENGVASSKPEDAFIPTTDELFDYSYQPHLYSQIQKLQQECLQKSDEKVAVAQQAYELINSKVQRLDHDLQAMEKLLQASGNFDSGVVVRPDDLAACQVTPGSEWILAKVIQHDPNTGIYQLADEDIESNKVFNLPEGQVQILYQVERLRSGDVVYAVYPDTTSFYQATVVQAPRRQGAGAAYVMVHFHDDADEFGVTHEKAVPLKHVMLPPPPSASA